MGQSSPIDTTSRNRTCPQSVRSNGFQSKLKCFSLLSTMQLQRERNGETELRGAEGDDGETRRPANSSRAERHDQGKQ